MRPSGSAGTAHSVPHHPNFLRCFGLSSLEELPELPNAGPEDGQITLEMQAAVERLRAGRAENAAQTETTEEELDQAAQVLARAE